MLDPWYITGFADGEAAFTYSRAGGSFGLYFAIKQREDNRQIIEEIYNFFRGIGQIYRGKGSEGAPSSGVSKPYTYYRVTRSSELQNIVEHFDKYPLQSLKKHAAYQVWRTMVIYKRDNYRNINFDHLSELAGKLSTLNLQSRAFKVHKKRWVK